MLSPNLPGSLKVHLISCDNPFAHRSPHPLMKPRVFHFPVLLVKVSCVELAAKLGTVGRMAEATAKHACPCA